MSNLIALLIILALLMGARIANREARSIASKEGWTKRKAKQAKPIEWVGEY